MTGAVHKAEVSPTIQAFAIDILGEAGSLRELPTPRPGPEDTLIAVRVADVNPIDWKVRHGFKHIGNRFPLMLGQNAADLVVEVGPNVKGSAVGGAVYGSFWLAGTYVDYVPASVRRPVERSAA